jgi:hypothetical protein
MLASFLVSFVPLPVDYYLGNEGEALFAPIAPVLLLLASGLVFVTWWVLTILMWSIGNIGTLFLGRSVVVFVVVHNFMNSVEGTGDARSGALEEPLLSRWVSYSY